MDKKSLFGIINVDKPAGMTSHDVIARLRKILNMKKIGHTGTLDPLATGVLPVCIGKATRVIQFLDDTKAYRAYIRLGVETSTYDSEGEILEKNPVKFDIEKVKQELATFQGTITQIPPMHSAVHYKGKRLYEYARKGVEIEDIPTRKVMINSIELVDTKDEDTDYPLLTVDIDCSSGTYIRSIVNDLGEKLRCGAMMEGLKRTRAGVFKIAESYTIEKIQEALNNNKLDEIIINPLYALRLKCLEINEKQALDIKQGRFLNLETELDENENIMLVFEKELVAIAKMSDNLIKPTNVFI